MKPALTPDDRRKRDLRRLRSGLVMLVALAFYGALLWPIRMSVTDDTYIHLVYAKHFRDGLGLVFNIGQPVFGTTSPLWSLGLGLLGRTGLGLLALARGLSMLFGALSIVAFAIFLRRFLESWVSEEGYGAGRSELAWALATVAFAGDAWLVRWSATGMETALAVFLVTAGFASYVSRRPWGNRVLVPAAWWSLAALARPEASVLLVLLLLRIVITSSPARLKLVRVAWVMLPIVLVHGAWLAYALALYHTAVPATLAAKTAAGIGPQVFARLLLTQGKAVVAARGVEFLVLIALAPTLASRFWVRRADHFVPLAWLLGLPLLYAARGVPAISRYLMPLFPLIVAYAWGTLAWLAAGSRRRPTLAITGLALAGVLSVGNSLYTYTRYVVPQAEAFSNDVDGTLGALGRWCRAHTEPGTEIAIPDIGAFAYFADRPVVDLAGLVTPAITPLLQRYPYDDLVTNLRYEGVSRAPYLVDRADRPYRMIFESPYASCLTALRMGRVDMRGIQHPEPAYYTLYRVDWMAFDQISGSERRAVGPQRSAPELAPCRGPTAPPTIWARWLGPGARPAGAEGWNDTETPREAWAGAEEVVQITTIDAVRTPTLCVVWGGRSGWRNTVDTCRETFLFNRFAEPDTLVSMRWTAAQLDTMRQFALELGILELQPFRKARVGQPGGSAPTSQDAAHVLDLEIDGVRRHFEWMDGGQDPAYPTLQRLIAFTNVLDAMIARHPAYRALPPLKLESE